MIIKALLGAAAVVAVAAPASATDATKFNGPRIEGRVGYEFVNSGVRNITEFGQRGQFGDDASGEKPVYGVEAGYDMPLGNFVFGGYVGFEHTDTTIRSPSSPYEFKTKGNFTAGVRGGFAVTPDVLIYAKVGYSRGNQKPSMFLAGSNPALFNNYDNSRDGIHVGGGVEVPVIDRFYVRADYVFHRYNSFDVGSDQRLRFNRHELVAGFGVRF